MIKPCTGLVHIITTFNAHLLWHIHGGAQPPKLGPSMRKLLALQAGKFPPLKDRVMKP